MIAACTRFTPTSAAPSAAARPTPFSHAEEEVFIDRWALSRGQPAAWDRLVRRCQLKMLRQARAIVRHSHEAQDVTQAVLVRLWRRRRQLMQTEALEPYLMKAVRNEACNALRRQKSQARLQELEATLANQRLWDDSRPDRCLERAELRAAVEAIDNRLTAAQRAVFQELRRDPDRSARQIGRRLGCSHKNVLAILRRIRRSVPDDQKARIREIARR